MVRYKIDCNASSGEWLSVISSAPFPDFRSYSILLGKTNFLLTDNVIDEGTLGYCASRGVTLIMSKSEDIL